MIKHMFAAAALVASASAAQAATVITIDGNSGSFAANKTGSGPFADDYIFTLPGTTGQVGASVISIDLAGSGGTLDLTNVFLNGADLAITRTGNLVMASGVINTFGGAGQTLRIVGTTTGLGGSYGGNVTFAAGAIPEPATWGMMILGFGAVGAAVRRRRSTAQVLA